MNHLAVVGAQWGDEGKGKVVDLLSENFDVVARFQGGPNAGHTVTFGGRRHALHHVPSGIFREHVRCVIGNGMVIDLGKLLEEIDGLRAVGVPLEGRLFLSDRAHVILPVMRQLDALSETAVGVGQRIGTTQRGIGPAYQSKAARFGLRVADLADRESLVASVERILAGPVGRWVRESGAEIGTAASIADEVLGHAERLRPFVADTALLLNDWMDAGMRALFEGAQGTLLDLDHGCYPFVTSSTTVAGGLCGGLGVAPTQVGGVLGVFKAYATRVGGGPMPTELDDGPDGMGERLRRRGREYGTTTGRPRRCGWFDGVAGWYATRINRFDAACVTLLDVLDDFDEILVCSGYRIDGEVVRAFPAGLSRAVRVEPVYEAIPGWREDLTGARAWSDLPAAALRYLDRLGEILGTEVAMVGVGPDREQSIVRPGSWMARELGV